MIRHTAIMARVLILALLVGSPATAEMDIPRVVREELATSKEPVVALEVGWNNPPVLSRVHCWWWWLNGNVTKEAITRDLEAMRDKGFGGANLVDAAHASSGQNRKPPHGPDFASQEWRDLFVHTLKEADRLGLEMGFNIQSGWNLGGPSVTPEQAAKKIVWSETVLEGGHRVHIELDKPKHEANLCVDVRVVALPLPAGDAPLSRIDNFEEKSYASYPGGFTAVDASHLVETGLQPLNLQAISPDKVIDLTSMTKSGVLDWKAPAGKWLVLRFAYTVSGAHVSTSSDNWKGWAIDYLDPTAFQQYCDDVLTPLLESARPYVGKSLKFLHTDSWELGPVNWTPAMAQQFRTRRGYDITPYLPALAGYVVASPEESNQFLNDFRRTIADLIADGKYLAFAKYAHERNLGVHPESGGPHAAPVDALLCLGRNDIPMGEFWARSKTHRTRDSSRLFVKQAASAAHIYGKRVVMAEAFTTIGPHWERDPQDLKPVFDRVACEGLNLVMWHTFDCSPAEEGVPGQAYFAGTHLNPNVTWWNQADGFINYLNRCQFLLQQGLPVSDVLYFYGENVPSFVRLKRDDPAKVYPDFEYDVINLEALTKRATVNQGCITLPDGVSYAALVLPPSGHYGLAALEQIDRLSEAGAFIVGEKPTKPMGLIDDPSNSHRFQQLADRLWSTDGVVDLPTIQALTERNIKPDFMPLSPTDRNRVDYIHRRTNGADIYFITNRRDHPLSIECSFRISGRQPELWDPMDATSVQATAFRQRDGRTIVPLRFPPNGSIFVLFRKPIDVAVQGVRKHNQPLLAKAENLLGPWQVAFDPTWGGPAETEFPTLIDWKNSPEVGIRHYSGTAQYRRSFQPPNQYQEGDRLWLDLGEVKNMARVFVNDKDLGVVWTRPFRVDITSAVKPGYNELRIDVVNLWPNRLIGDAKLPPERRKTKTNIRKFTANDSLLSSGLLGPVTLMKAEDIADALDTPNQEDVKKIDPEGPVASRARPR